MYLRLSHQLGSRQSSTGRLILGAPHYPVPIPQPPSGTRQGVANTAWLRWAKSISATVLAMLIVADVGANAAHNAGAVVSRIVPIMHDQPFYFDPLAIVHDVEQVIH